MDRGENNKFFEKLMQLQEQYKKTKGDTGELSGESPIAPDDQLSPQKEAKIQERASEAPPPSTQASEAAKEPGEAQNPGGPGKTYQEYMNRRIKGMNLGGNSREAAVRRLVDQEAMRPDRAIEVFIRSWKEHAPTLQPEQKEKEIVFLGTLGSHDKIAWQILTAIQEDPTNEALQELHRRFDDPDMY